MVEADSKILFPNSLPSKNKMDWDNLHGSVWMPSILRMHIVHVWMEEPLNNYGVSNSWLSLPTPCRGSSQILQHCGRSRQERPLDRQNRLSLMHRGRSRLYYWYSSSTDWKNGSSVVNQPKSASQKRCQDPSWLQYASSLYAEFWVTRGY